LCVRVAGDVNDSRGGEFEQLLEEKLVATLTRRIDENRRLVRRERNVLRDRSAVEEGQLQRSERERVEESSRRR
jgi:hypothetical protein